MCKVQLFQTWRHRLHPYFKLKTHNVSRGWPRSEAFWWWDWTHDGDNTWYDKKYSPRSLLHCKFPALHITCILFIAILFDNFAFYELLQLKFYTLQLRCYKILLTGVVSSVIIYWEESIFKIIKCGFIYPEILRCATVGIVSVVCPPLAPVDVKAQFSALVHEKRKQTQHEKEKRKHKGEILTYYNLLR